MVVYTFFFPNAGSRRTKLYVFRGRCDRQRTLVIRIAAIILASDSAITLERFRPSNPKNLLRQFFCLGGCYFLFSAVIFEDPLKIPFKTSVKIASRGYFYFSRLILASRGYF